MTKKLFPFFNLIFLFFPLFCFAQTTAPADTLSQANSLYQKGLDATTLQDRKIAFNSALTLYLTLENSSPPTTPQLYAAIADTFYHLEEYAWSILYNKRALKLDPRNSTVQNHLALSQNKLGLSPEPENWLTMKSLLSLNGIFPLSSRLQLFLLLSLLTLAICSTLLWYPIRVIQLTSRILLFTSAILLLNLIISFYFIPIEAIIIQPTGLFSQPDINQPQLDVEPLVKGTSVKVISSQQEGNWLKISDSKNSIGYIPIQSVRII